MLPSEANHSPETFVAELRDASLRYDGRTALDRVSLGLPAGAVVGLVGPNGAGKSTLLRCLLGLALPQEGEVRLLGEPAGELSDAVRARIGFVPQVPELIEWMTVQQHLDYIGSFYPRWDAARVLALALAWGLEPGQVVARLSLGAKQKLAVLLALGHAPELIVLDEPVASLDPLMRREFMRTLFEPAAERTIVVSSHLLSDLQRVITHVAFMRAGRIVMFDEWDALVESVRRVEGVAELAQGPGVLSNPLRPGHGLIDLRRYPAESLPPAARLSALNLDDLFVELMA
jgi:ABC-2 type transport system ATP-binding protein